MDEGELYAQAEHDDRRATVAALRSEIDMLRKILARVPGRIALKAKEDAGFGTAVHTLSGPAPAGAGKWWLVNYGNKEVAAFRTHTIAQRWAEANCKYSNVVPASIEEVQLCVER